MLLKAEGLRLKKLIQHILGCIKTLIKLNDYLNKIENLYCVGRNGQHKYNNMDHSVLSGIVAARVIKEDLPKKILWDVNTEQEYHEIRK